MKTAELSVGDWAPSYTQEGMWLFERTFPGTSAQNIGLAAQLSGSLDPERLGTSLETAARHHPATFSGLREEAGQPRVSVFSLPPTLEQVEDSDDGDPASLIPQWLDTPFRLDEPPLLRAVLIRRDPLEHILLLVSHRSVADWSALNRFLTEIWRHYAGPKSPPRKDQAPDYREFAQRQRREMDSAPFQERARAYVDHLVGAPPMLELPGTHNAPDHRTFRGGSVREDLSPEEVSTLLDTPLAKTGEGPETVLFTGLAALLGRYTGQEEVVVGWTATPELDNPKGRPLGPLENRLPVRAAADPDCDFREQVKRTRGALDHAWGFRHIPFELLLRKASLPRGLARPPLIQALFEYRVETSGERANVPGLAMQREEIPPGDTALDLHLVITRRAEGMEASLRFNRDLFDEAGARRLLANFRTLLASGMEDPDSPVGSLDMVGPEEHRTVVHDFNRTDAPYPAHQPLHELIREQARRTPEAPAYHFEGRTATYREVDGWTEALAQRLQDMGVGRGRFVPLLMDRSLELPVCMLGIMKAGAVFVPMDMHWPAERIRDIVADAEPPVVLVRDADTATDRLPEGTDWLGVAVDDLKPPSAPVDAAVDSDDPIYMIYTSGSTGKPKGAINRHRGIVNRLTYMTRRYGFGPEDVVLQTSAHIFDASVWQYFWPLINGGPVVLPAPMAGFDYDHVTRLIERYRVTITDFVPSVFNLLVDFMERDVNLRGRLTSLRQVLIGGEALSPEPAFRFRTHLPQTGITNTYGPTETSIGVIFYEVGEEYEDPLPIGRPIDNVHTYILNDHMQPVPIGVSGMLHLGGECVGLGYHRRLEKTREAFLPSPFPENHPGWVYRTGDLGRYRSDGTIEFLGRSDHQVKIRGLRIELGEIESKLVQHPEVQAAVVAVWDTQEGGKRLAAYFVPVSGAQPTASGLRAFLKASLPEYVLPHAFMPLQELPQLRSGKIDRKALPEPQEIPEPEDHQGPPPSTDTEQRIAAIWRTELGLDRVSVKDNFFEIGGDSLAAVKVSAQLEYETGLRVEAEQMMIQTLGQLAASVDGGESRPQTVTESATPGAEIEPMFLGSSTDQLFAVLHPHSAIGEERPGVVLCPPLGHEYLFTHRAVRNLAERISTSGMNALRFDYPGTGDSMGEPEEVSLESCVAGVQRAVAALRERQSGEGVVLVGLRLGGAIAAQAAARLQGVSGLVMWDPVHDGVDYLAELADLHRRWLGGKAPVFTDHGEGTEVADLVGFPATRSLYADIQAIDEQTFGPLRTTPALLIDSTEAGHQRPLAEWAGDAIAYRQIPYPEIWNQDPYKTQLPHHILQAAASWLTGARP